MKKFKKQFGGKATPEMIKRYSYSDNWKNGKFENLEETDMSISFWEIPELLYEQLCSKNNRTPGRPLEIERFDTSQFLQENTNFKFAWYGHSAVICRLNGKTILIDPMLGDNASPIAPYKTARFSPGTIDTIQDFPDIDLVMMSHDHYDHLDMDSILKLKTKVKQFHVALGVKRHLVEWGIDSAKIEEFDWWQTDRFHDINITFTPTRHFSGRGIRDRSKSLWGGWAFKTEGLNVWFSGDGGYGAHFKKIGDRVGPFDFGFMECGQYNEKWRSIHLFPDESIQAALDAGVKLAMPVHWAGFALSSHSWKEPAELFQKFASENHLPTLFPRIGQIVDLDIETKAPFWWELIGE